MIFGGIFESSKTKAIKANTEALKENTRAKIENATASEVAENASKKMQFVMGGIKKALITSAIIATTTAIYELATSQKKLNKKAEKLSSTLKEEEDSISKYKTEIKDLNEVIYSNASSTEEIANARIRLIQIQDELIDKFGTEKTTIEQVTLAINDQADALDELLKKSYFEKKNEFNQRTIGEKINDFLTFGNIDSDKIQSNMDKMVSEMESGFVKLTTTGNKELDNFISESLNINIVGDNFHIIGSLQEISDKLYEIQDITSDMEVSTAFENDFTNASNEVDEYLKANQELYKQYILYEKVLSSAPENNYDDYFNSLNEAKEKFDEANESGNTDSIKKAGEEYAYVLNNAMKEATNNYDYGVAEYFKNLYPELQSIVSEWKFNTNFTTDTDGLKEKIESALKQLDGFSVEKIENLDKGYFAITEEQKEGYTTLNSIAEQYGMTLSGLLSILQDLQLVFPEEYLTLLNQYEEAVANRKEKYSGENKVGNVDINNRPVIVNDDGSYSTTSTSFQEKWIGDEDNGSYKIIHFTPILPDGTILEGNALDAYIDKVLNSDDPIAADDPKNGGKGIVYRVDTEVNGEKITDRNIEDAFGIASAWDEEMHNIQNNIYSSEGQLKVQLEQFWNNVNLKPDKEDIVPDTSTITDSIKQISKQLEPQFSELKKLYQSIFKEDKKGKKSFSLEDIGNEELESLRAAFADIEENIGVTFDTSELESFFTVLRNSNSTAEQVQQAFNKLATSYLYSTDVLSNLNTKTAESTAMQLEQMGVTNASMVVFAALVNKTNALADAGIDLKNATDEEIQGFVNENVSAEYAGQALALLQLKKVLLNDTLINTESDINQVYALAQAAGIGVTALDKLSKAKATWQAAKDSGDAQKLAAANRAIHDLDAQFRNEVENWQPAEVDWKPKAGSAGSAGKEAADEYLKAFEKELEKLDNLKERGVLTEKQYLDTLRALYEKYFKDKEKYADKYREYEARYLRESIALQERAIDGIISIIDDHISALEDEKQAAIDALEAERDAAVEALEARKEQIEAEKEALQEKIDAIDDEIDAKQDQIDAINEEAEAKKKAYDLDKAQYELDRLKNQKTIYEYSGKDKGFIYKTDDAAIRDQQMEVEDIEREIRIDGIEKEIDLLEKEKEVLQDQQEELDKQAEAIEKRIDAMNEYYDNMIKQTEAYWDNIIKGFEETKTRWEELKELQEKAELAVTLQNFGINIGEVLEMTDAEFEAFKQSYLSKLADLNAGNQQMLDALTQISGVDLSTLPGYLEQTQQYINMLGENIDFSNLNDGLGNVIQSLTDTAEAAGIATGAIGGGNFSISTGQGGDKEGQGQGANQGGGDNLQDGIKTMAEVSVPEINKVASSLGGGNEEGGEEAGVSVEAGATAARDVISTGDTKGSGSGKEGEDATTLQGALDTQTKAALNEEAGIPAQITKWTELEGVLDGVLKKLNEIEQKIQHIGELDLENLGVGSGGEDFFAGTDPNFKVGKAFVRGVNGLPKKEKDALRSEYGQPELTIYPNGRTELTTTPIISDLPKGTVVYNEDQTRDILSNKPKILNAGTAVDSAVLKPIDSNNYANYDLMEKAFGISGNALFADALSNNLSKQIRSIKDVIKPLSNKDANIEVTIGDIHLHEVQDVDTLSRELTVRFPTELKQAMSIYKKK